MRTAVALLFVACCSAGAPSEMGQPGACTSGARELAYEEKVDIACALQARSWRFSSVAGPQECKLTSCAAVEQCIECVEREVSGTSQTVSINLVGCKDEALSWACCRTANCTLSSCAGGPVEPEKSKCNEATYVTFELPATNDKLELQVHDGQIAGNVTCPQGAFPQDVFCGGCGSNCGGSTGSGVCTIEIDLYSCPLLTTQPPTTQLLTTEEPTTQPLTTAEPTTASPTTQPPTTEEPTTESPTTQPLTTEEPTTKSPTTQPLTTRPPTTPPPTTAKPPKAPCKTLCLALVGGSRLAECKCVLDDLVMCVAQSYCKGGVCPNTAGFCGGAESDDEGMDDDAAIAFGDMDGDGVDADAMQVDKSTECKEEGSECQYEAALCQKLCALVAPRAALRRKCERRCPCHFDKVRQVLDGFCPTTPPLKQ